MKLAKDRDLEKLTRAQQELRKCAERVATPVVSRATHRKTVAELNAHIQQLQAQNQELEFAPSRRRGKILDQRDQLANALRNIESGKDKDPQAAATFALNTVFPKRRVQS